MKISNETKVGAIAIVSITLLILGFNFLKGKKVFSKTMTLYAVYSNVQGLTQSNQVMINGWQVGSIYELSADKNMKEILVTINITKDVNIPVNSIAIIKSNPIANPSIEIMLGDATTYLQNNDTLKTEAGAGMLDQIMKKTDPILFEIKKAAGSLDTLIDNFNVMLDPNAKNNFADILSNLNKITASFVASSANLQRMLDAKTGSITSTINNLNSVTGNLASNNGHVSNMLSNLDSTSAKLAKLNLEQTMATLNEAINELKITLNKLNSGNGTAGRLMNDPALYENLSATSNKLNILLDDFRLHPKRYISFPLIGSGKKKNASPLMKALPDTLNAPYPNKK